MEVETDLKVF